MPTLVRGKFYTGALPSPRHKLLAAVPFRPLTAPPPQAAWVAPRLDVWGNDRFGCCVSSEEAEAKAGYSVGCGLPEVFATADEVVQFADRYGFLNGATLTDVMDVMKADGMSIGGRVYKDGGYAGVDYSNEATLQAAIAQGPVKIAIDHSALPADAGNKQGWVAVGGSPGQYGNTDHCVGIVGYGPAAWLCQQIGVPVPAGIDPARVLYLIFTWGTYGLGDHPWIMSTTAEGWNRIPTTVGQSPSPTPTPIPEPTPVPIPTKPTVFTGTATGRVPVFGGPVTLAVTLTEQPAPAPHFHAAPSAESGLTLVSDLAALVADLQARNYLGVIRDLEAIAADPDLAKAVAVVRLVVADVKAGKSLAQIVQDVTAAVLAA